MHTCYETAIETFKAIFGNRDELRDEEAINGFLAAATSADNRYILHTLYKWMEAAMTQYGAEEGLLHLTAHTVEELSRKMEPFVRTCTHILGDEGGSSPSLWPLVEIVRVGLQRPLLQRSIVLADLPGQNASLPTVPCLDANQIHFVSIRSFRYQQDQKEVYDAIYSKVRSHSLGSTCLARRDR